MIIITTNRIALVLLLIFVSSNIALSSQDFDFIILKNGSKIYGQIIKFDIDNEIIIKTASGTELSYKMSDVEKIYFKSKYFEQYEKTNWELGISVGMPLALNLVVGKHFKNLMVKGVASRFHYDSSELNGLQIEFGYKFSEIDNTYHAINIVSGFLNEINTNENNLGVVSEFKYRWDYTGIVYNLNTNGFYFQAGLGNFKKSTLSHFILFPIFQIGYVYQFRN